MMTWHVDDVARTSCSIADFKKADNEEKSKLFGNLLKAYQEEVDNLTKRAKFGENSFLNVYQKLYEAPDPVPALASATVSALPDSANPRLCMCRIV